MSVGSEARAALDAPQASAAWRRHRLARLLALAVVASIPPRATAATGPPLPATVTTIAIEDAGWVPPELLVSVSRLDASGSYTPHELRDAVRRIARLPFVLAADHDLESNESGDHRLVIRVVPGRRWFFGTELAATRWAEPVSLVGLDVEDYSGSAVPLAGWRTALGRRGLFHAALGTEGSDLRIGFARYGLLGRDAVFELAAGVRVCDAERDPTTGLPDEGCRAEIFGLGLDPAFVSWTEEGDGRVASLALTVPLRGNQALRLAGEYAESDAGHRRTAYRPSLFDGFDFRNRELLAAELLWLSDSTDDEAFPTRGWRAEAGLTHRSLAADLTTFDLPFTRIPILFVAMASDETLAGAAGRRHWPLGRRHTLTAGAAAAAGRADLDGVPLRSRRVVSGEADVWSARLELGHAFDLRRSRHRPGFRELRWENRLELFGQGTSPDFDLPENPLYGLQASSGLTFRTSWGSFGLILAWLDAGG